MPEDSKKNHQKSRNDPKEQRKRRGRQHAPAEKKVEKAPEPPKVTVPEKPAYEPPPPEFFKSLKRETDEILKITEEANTKYKKKEIQSNWAKYEMPIESYEEIDEQENLGADYEALIQAPLSVGGHFQFKHEKSWDTTTGPSPYDKYFDINMENLSLALSSIPFYERNSIDTSFFSENDILTMNHKATKFKQKYYNDSKFTTPELEAQAKILNSLTKTDSNIEFIESNENSTNDTIEDKKSELKEINLEECEEPNDETISVENVTDKIVSKNVTTPEKTVSKEKANIDSPKTETHKTLEVVENVVKELAIADNENLNDMKEFKNIDNKIVGNKELDDFEDITQNSATHKNEEKIKLPQKEEMQFRPAFVQEEKVPKAPSPPKEPAKNPVIESPEDLEKWLDDFLDG